MRILLRRDDIAARHVDDQFLVAACHPVKPEKLFLYHQVEEECYEYLPVQVKEQVVFIAPNTHDVKLHSRAVNCPLKPLRNNHEIIAGLGLNNFLTKRTLFTGIKLPDIGDEWIKLAIDRKQRYEPAEQVSNPFEQRATSTDEFLEEIGGKAEETTKLIKNTLYLLLISWKWICSFVLFPLFLLSVSGI
ncbi:unnamed protein product [Enterobius vermicularis]|uniref:TraG-D_C domain-containing protein n=1 Tax=Enterobius vermicularis TaxID=51028 RepID=A0A0N4VMY1_ENTVE|nr:unnamed protein product [Enterobius vermicularis]